MENIIEEYKCDKCGHTLLKSNKSLHDLNCKPNNPLSKNTFSVDVCEATPQQNSKAIIKLFDNLYEFQEFYLIKDNNAFKLFIGKREDGIIINF